MTRQENARPRFTFALLALFPAAVGCFALALRFPDATERVYSQSLYPIVLRAFAFSNRVTFSLAEPIALVVVVLILLMLSRAWRGEKRWRALFVGSTLSVGVIAATFLLLWGFNYARPTLAVRSQLTTEDVVPQAVLSVGERAATLTTELYDALDDNDAPTSSPLSFAEINQALDDAYARVSLPGDNVEFEPTPAKPLASSTLFSYLGISGIFIPFTGEPSVNVLQPDVAIPLVVAHEKAHQRGVTNEGEANFAAFLACADRSSPPYFRYAAYLFATRHLLGTASRHLPQEEVADAWSRLGDGPRRDLRAIQEFWQDYDGPAAAVASRANDQYLKTMQVEDGARSYGTVVNLLMALEARGELFVR